MRDTFERILAVAEADKIVDFLLVTTAVRWLVVDIVVMHSDVGTSTTSQESPAIGTTLQVVCPEQSVFAGQEQALAAG